MAASEMSDATIRDILFRLRKSDFWDPDTGGFILARAFRLFRGYGGYLKGDGFAGLLEQIPVKNIEACKIPLVISATNLTSQGEEMFTQGGLVRALTASGAVPMLFKPVEIGGSLYVDGGMVSKAPVRALADLVNPEIILIHFVESGNLGLQRNVFMRKPMTFWHIYQLAVSIARRESYKKECELVKERGIRLIEIKTKGPSVSPKRLVKGRAAYRAAYEEAHLLLEREGL
jgi:NTE family protein